MVRYPTLLKVSLGCVAIAVNLSLHAQMAQDPLLNRSGSVEPNVVFVLDDSGSMDATAIYQYGASYHGYGASGPANRGQSSSSWTSDPPPDLYGRSPDVNLLYYDPRITYKRQINADGTFKDKGSYDSSTTWNVYFYKPDATYKYSVASVSVTANGSGYPAAGITATFPVPPAGGTRATATVTTQAITRVNSVTIANKGSNYSSSGVTVTFSPPPSGTRAMGSVNLEQYNAGYVESVDVPTGDFPSNASCTVTFDAPPAGGVRAEATAVLRSTPGEDPIGTFTLTNPGAGYTTAPNGSVRCGTRTRTFTTTLARPYRISGVTITDPGSGYTSAPTVTFSAPNAGGTTATGTAVLGTTYIISAITVTNPGAGYNTQPTLTLAGTGSGSGVAYIVDYNSTLTSGSGNAKWPGSGPDPTLATSYFSEGTPAGYRPDAGSPLAVGANASIRYPNAASSSITQYPKFRDRTDCVTVATHCTWDEEAQNYANWKLYHSTRLRLAKTGIGLAFQPLNPTFRLGYGQINTLDSGNLKKGVRRYTSTVASDFLTWLYSVSADGGTPNLLVAQRVGTYFQRADDNGPWGDNPDGSASITSTDPENRNHASCRRSYWMLMTDGYYNSASGFSQNDADTTNGPTITSPSTYQYTPIGPYSDTASGTPRSNTFADVAMYYYLNDLRPNIANNVRPVTGDEAFWQHLTFYGIGLGVVGTLDNTSASVLASLSGTTSSGRTRDWPAPSSDNPTAIDDMWHATLNSRGRMLNAKNADELNSAIARMMSDISGREGTQAGVAVSTTSLTRGTKKYTPSYTPNTWNGNVTAYKLDSVTGVQSAIAWQVETLTATDPITGARTYTSLIPSASSRKVFVGNAGASAPRAVEFKYATLGSLASQMTGTVSANLIDYLRGDATNEDTSSASASPTAIYRARSTRLGDIINSTPAFVKDALDMNYDKLPSGAGGQSSYRTFVGLKKARAEGVIFVGANDGMLHAFRDGTYDVDGNTLTPGGAEVFAYVPNAVLPALHLLADKAYTHRYYVDGPIVEADAYLSGGWKNMVVGTMGAGGGVLASAGVSPKSAVFAIDTTSLNGGVTGLGASSVMWEVHSGVANFGELGHVLYDVQTGVTTDGTWVAVFGNGYESKSCKASLFVVNLETGAFLREIPTNVGTCTTGGKNGLGGVRLVRNDHMQIIGAYAGDLQGNMWKFNMTAGAPTSWSLDLGGSALMALGSTRPITAPPTVLPLPMVGTTDPKPGYMVVFGTGRFFQTSDATDNSQQSLFGIWDPAAFGAGTYSGVALSGTGSLVAQTIGSAQTAGGNVYYSISNNAVSYTGPSAKRGWYINFPNTGQRLVYPLDLLANRFAVADTIAPVNVSSDPCNNEASGIGYLYIVDAVNGGGPTEAILDTNGDGNVDSSDLVVSGIEGKADGRNVSLLVNRNELVTTYANVSGGDPGATKISLSCRLTNTCVVPAGVGVRRQWRQLFLR